MATWTNETPAPESSYIEHDTNQRLYYYKVGKLYILTGVYNPSMFTCIIDGDDSTTVSKCATVLGITASANIYSVTTQYDNMVYWNSTQWSRRSNSTKTLLLGILAA